MGVVHEHCSVDRASYGYGLYAGDTINPGSTLCAIPSKVCISAPSDSSSALDSIARSLCDEVARGEAGFFAPFIDILPKDTSYIPACYDGDRLQTSLAGTALSLDALKMRGDWNRDFDARRDDGTSREMYMWARATLQGRAYRVGEVISFIPFVTFANHDDAMVGSSYLYPAFSNGVSYPKDFIVLQADRRYVRGQKILTSYGSLSFQQKLLSFGYTDRASSFGITAIDIPRSASGEQVEIRTSIEWDLVTPRGKSIDVKKEVSRAIRIMSAACTCSKEQSIATIKAFLSMRIGDLKRGVDADYLAPECHLADDADDDTVRKVEINSIFAIIREMES